MSFNVIVRAISGALYPSITSLTFTSATSTKITLPAIQVTSAWTRCSANEALVIVAVSVTVVRDCIGFQVRVPRLISRIKARVIGQLMSSCLDSDMFNSVRQRYVNRYIRRVYIHTKYIFSPTPLTEVPRTSFCIWFI